MNIIVGATGRVGSHVIQRLRQEGQATRAVIRSANKLIDQSTEYRVADLFDAEQLIDAFQGGTTAFLMTPENPASKNVLEDTHRIVDHYKKAIQASGIKKVVALSCIGAHLEGDTGNILMSRILEQELEPLDVAKVFIRPSYYFSNWIGYWEMVIQHGILPSFFPENLKLDMHSPEDLAAFIAQVIARPVSSDKEIYELVGPEKYNARDVSKAFSLLLNKNVGVQPVLPGEWKGALMAAGFTDDAADHLSAMTQAVIDGQAVPEWPDNTIKLPTSLLKYLEKQLKAQE
jgi:uncharacterized protein YbjT (DUF2867 family)